MKCFLIFKKDNILTEEGKFIYNIFYTSLEKEKRAEFWFNLQSRFVQGSIEEQWLLDRAIEADPSFTPAYMEKSVSHNKRGNFSIGMEILAEAVNRDPIGYLGYRGFLKLYMLHDYQGAFIDYTRLDSLTPDFRDAPWGEDIYKVIGLPATRVI